MKSSVERDWNPGSHQKLREPGISKQLRGEKGSCAIPLILRRAAPTLGITQGKLWEKKEEEKYEEEEEEEEKKKEEEGEKKKENKNKMNKKRGKGLANHALRTHLG